MVEAAAPRRHAAPTAGTGGGGGGRRAAPGALSSGLPYRNDGITSARRSSSSSGTASSKIDWEDSLLDDVAEGRIRSRARAPSTTYTAGQLDLRAQDVQELRHRERSLHRRAARRASRRSSSHYETYSYQVCTNYNPHYEQVHVLPRQLRAARQPRLPRAEPHHRRLLVQREEARGLHQGGCAGGEPVHLRAGRPDLRRRSGRAAARSTRPAPRPTRASPSRTRPSSPIYRFEGGSFTKLDSSLAKMIEKDGAISFENTPLSVKGADREQEPDPVPERPPLRLRRSGAADARRRRQLDLVPQSPRRSASNTATNPSIVFSSDRAMISASTNYTTRDRRRA